MKIKRFILVILIILWAVLVFFLSNQSSSDSTGLSYKVALLFSRSEELAKTLEPYIRKLAHYSEYAVGGILFTLLFSTYDWSDKRIIVTSILCGIWYSGLDEIHQLYKHHE